MADMEPLGFAGILPSQRALRTDALVCSFIQGARRGRIPLLEPLYHAPLHSCHSLDADHPHPPDLPKAPQSLIIPLFVMPNLPRINTAHGLHQRNCANVRFPSTGDAKCTPRCRNQAVRE